jgi:hypothetical protein
MGEKGNQSYGALGVQILFDLAFWVFCNVFPLGLCFFLEGQCFGSHDDGKAAQTNWLHNGIWIAGRIEGEETVERDKTKKTGDRGRTAANHAPMRTGGRTERLVQSRLLAESNMNDPNKYVYMSLCVTPCGKGVFSTFTVSSVRPTPQPTVSCGILMRFVNKSRSVTLSLCTSTKKHAAKNPDSRTHCVGVETPEPFPRVC